MAKKKLTIEDVLVPNDEIPYGVPENWCWTRMQYIGKWSSGGTPKSTIKDYYDGQIPWLVIADLNDNYVIESKKNITHLGLENSSAKIIPKNSVLVAMYGSIGKLGINTMLCTCNQAIAYMKEDYNITNNKYLFYYLLSQRDYLNSLGKGGTQQNISLTVLNKVSIPLPPLSEQERIVNRIESLFEKLDKASELVEEAREGFEKRRAAILEKAFSGELTKSWREENGISDEWKSNVLKNVCKITSGGTPSRKNPQYYDGNIPWIKTGEIRWNDLYDSEEHINEEAIKHSSAKLIPKDTVLVAMYGQGMTRGRASILRKESATNQAVCSLIPSDKVNCEFLYYYFMKNYWRFRQLAKGGNQENLSGKVIGEFEIELPSIKEQLEVVNILKKVLDKEDMIDEITSIDNTIQTMKKSILAKAFRGELGSNDLKEESSIELLKEILK